MNGRKDTREESLHVVPVVVVRVLPSPRKKRDNVGDQYVLIPAVMFPIGGWIWNFSTMADERP